ncbi:DUF6988 family protein [Luteimonas sp. MHLX1A]|uniref:DUF6988 family protein n=1 Tax=Alterluteimonas muca TaxID=2878684 RepID=UPI001E55E268|nr:hypothetical protein [Luteimonas sp. MHLX1A]MCD9047088.1 hypothetical protein [Luteimonas sp. MHLX1A]
MPNENSLSDAVHRVVEQWSRVEPVTEGDLTALAASARNVNEQAIAFLSDLPPVQAEHHYLSLQLIRAACDHGRGLLFLIETNFRDMGAPALALHRSQIENFLRGVFLGFLADEEQREDFLENDVGVRQKNENGKWQVLGTKSLAQSVEAFINELADSPLDDPEKFSRMVTNTWNPLCGLVHGGRAIHALYRDGQGLIGGDISLGVLFQCVSNCFVITNFCFMTVIAHIYRLAGIPTDCALNVAMNDFIELQRRIRAKQLAGGA